MLNGNPPLWKHFNLDELHEIMRQRGDSDLIDLLNKVRTASLEECDETILKSRFESQNDDNYPCDALHIFAENKPCQEHNSNMLKSNNVLCSIPAIDTLPKNVSQNVIEKVLIVIKVKLVTLLEILRSK